MIKTLTSVEVQATSISSQSNIMKFTTSGAGIHILHGLFKTNQDSQFHTYLTLDLKKKKIWQTKEELKTKTKIWQAKEELVTKNQMRMIKKRKSSHLMIFTGMHYFALARNSSMEDLEQGLWLVM